MTAARTALVAAVLVTGIVATEWIVDHLAMLPPQAFWPLVAALAGTGTLALRRWMRMGES